MQSRVSTTTAHQKKTVKTAISSHSRSLAMKLSNHMGIDAAIRVSEENQWHGVLAALQEIQSS